jgi:DNA-binding LytR/AlgR family response regulator
MITIVVVDDDERYLKQTKEIIKKINFQMDQEIETKFYTKYSPSLEKEINKLDLKKIYILDIDLNDTISGLNIAQKIRENDWDSEIIFITNHDKQFENVYRNVYKVFAFIEKFHEFESKLEKNIKLIIKKNFDNKMFTYHNRNVDITIYYRSILYIFCNTEARKLEIVTTNNHYLVSYSLEEMITHLDSRFCIVHRACIINKDHVIEYNWSKGYFVLDNKKEVPLLSKKYKKSVEK